MIAAAAPAPECLASPSHVTDPRAVRLALTAAYGTTLPPSRPEAALDGQATPAWGGGWLVRPDGAPPRLELAFDRPRHVESVQVVVRPLDGSFVRARLLGRDSDGRWRPLAGGGQREELACGEMRVYRLAPLALPLAALAIEFQGEALSHRIAVHEVWALERR